MSNNCLVAAAANDAPAACAASLSEARVALVNAYRDHFQEVLTCTLCARICYLLPIYQCRKGHVVCSRCYGPFEHCRICKVSLYNSDGFIRCLALEQMAEVMDFRCPNKNNGCDDTIKWPKLKTHVLDCQFGYNLFCGRIFGKDAEGLCRSTKMADIAHHLQTTHNMSQLVNGVMSGDDVNQNLRLSKFGTWNLLYWNFIEHDGKVFILKTKLAGLKRQLRSKILMLGSKTVAKQYHAKITFALGSPTPFIQGYQIEWNGLVIGFAHQKEKSGSEYKFIIPWEIIQAQKKRFEKAGDGFAWKVVVEISSY